jgi:hypothetical protein
MADRDVWQRVALTLEAALIEFAQREALEGRDVVHGVSMFAATTVRRAHRRGSYYRAIDVFLEDVRQRAMGMFDADGAPYDDEDEPVGPA